MQTHYHRAHSDTDMRIVFLPASLARLAPDRLQAIARTLRDDPANNESLAELGRAAGASGRTLSRLFRDELGMTFYEWRTQLRIYHALILLAFTSIVGTTPGRYRRLTTSRLHGPAKAELLGWLRCVGCTGPSRIAVMATETNLCNG